MTKEIEFTLPPGDQVDLEIEIFKLMVQRAIDNPEYADANPWGEFLVLQGNILHCVQWSYVGDEVHDEEGKFICFNFYGNPDFQIDSSWWEVENYSAEENEDDLE